MVNGDNNASRVYDLELSTAVRTSTPAGGTTDDKPKKVVDTNAKR